MKNIKEDEIPEEFKKKLDEYEAHWKSQIIKQRDEEWISEIEKLKVKSEPLKFSQNSQPEPETMYFEYDSSIKCKGFNERLDDLINKMTGKGD